MKICFISANPNFLGGVSLYLHNFIRYLKSIGFNRDITWVYKGKNNRVYEKNGVKFVEIKVSKTYVLDDLVFNLKLIDFLKDKDFNIINSHAIWGYWLKSYKKKKGQKIIHTYHGTAYYFYKNHLKRFNPIVRIFLSPLLLFGKIIERPPVKKADKIVCVSNKVKNEIISLYGRRGNIEVIRTGVDLNLFKTRDKIKTRGELNLEKNGLYGLYVGRGGYWTKGFDRVINLSKELYKINQNYRLIVIGVDKNKVKQLVKDKFIILLSEISREKIPYYYDASDIFFCLSRYDGGAPTLVTSEAMASGCLVVCSKDAKQEVIENEKDGLIIGENYEKEAERILNNMKNKERLSKSAQKLVKNISLDKWGRRYLTALSS